MKMLLFFFLQSKQNTGTNLTSMLEAKKKKNLEKQRSNVLMIELLARLDGSDARENYRCPSFSVTWTILRIHYLIVNGNVESIMP